MLSYGLQQMCHEPSRITSNSKTCFDNIFANVNANNIVTETINTHIADHMGQILHLQSDKINETKYEYRRSDKQ